MTASLSAGSAKKISNKALTCAGEPERAGWCDPVVSSVSASDCSDPSGGPANDCRTSVMSGTSELQDRKDDMFELTDV